MITKVVAKNFKGLEFERELGPKTLIFGANGTGKSAIVQALELALNGNIAGAAHKTNQAVFEAFSSGDKMTVEVTLGEVALGRQFSRDDRGAVSQLLMVNRRRADAKAFASALGAAGAPRVVVVGDFLALPPTRMVSYLAEFTGGDELDKIAQQITATNNLLNQARATQRENDGYISRSLAAIASLNLPPGSLPEIQAEIKKIEGELAEAKRSLRKAKEEELERQRAVELEAKRKLQEKDPREMQTTAGVNQIPESLQNELGDLGPAQRPLTEFGKEFYPQGRETITTPDARPSLKPYGKMPEVEGVAVFPIGQGPAESIQKIIDAIAKQACPTCGGGIVLMTAKAELKKWRNNGH